MNTLIINDSNTRYRLVADENVAPDKRVVLASTTVYEGDGAWDFCDLRLKSYRKPGPMLSIWADDLHAELVAESEDERDFYRAKLKDWAPDPDNEMGTRWCTYNGVARGRTPSELGLTSSFPHHDWPVLFKRSEVLQKMRELKQFWADQPFSERDPNLRDKIENVSVDNPWRQPSSTVLSLEWSIARRAAQAGAVVDALSNRGNHATR